MLNIIYVSEDILSLFSKVKSKGFLAVFVHIYQRFYMKMRVCHNENLNALITGIIQNIWKL